MGKGKVVILLLTGILAGSKAYALHQTPGVVEPGDKIALTIPLTNGSDNDGDLSNARTIVISAPAWLTLLPTSFTGPVELPTGESVDFILHFEINGSFTPAQAAAQVVVEVKTDVTNLNATLYRWHFRTSNGFKTSNAECLDEEGGSYGGALSPDTEPPETTLSFIGPTFTDSQGALFISSSTALSLEGIDAIVVDAVTSEVAFTGFKLDQSIGDVNLLDVFVGTFTVSASGSHFIVFGSSDNAGNAESVKISSFIVDVQAPATPSSLLAGGANPSPWRNISTFTVTLSGSDDASGVGGAFVKLGEAPASPNDGSFMSNFTSFNFTSGNLVNGSNPLYVWLADNVGNTDNATAQIVNLRYDDLKPQSTAAVLVSTFSVGPIPVSFASFDQNGTVGSGMERTFLWFRRDNNDDGILGDWQQTGLEILGNTGNFIFEIPGLQDGNYEFYTQAKDIAGNFEDAPLSTTPAKAGAFFDASSAVISNVQVPLIASNFAQIVWTTDDRTTALVEYSTNSAFPIGLTKTKAVGVSTRTHGVFIDCSVLSPAVIYFRITAINKTGLITTSQTGNFTTPANVFIPQDIFGVVDVTKPIAISVTNPGVTMATVTINGQTVFLVLSTSSAAQVFVDTGTVAQGEKNVNISLDGFGFNQSVLIDTAQRTARLARLSINSGGGFSEAIGQSQMEIAIGEIGPGPDSSISTTGYLASGANHLYTGYFAGIDPVAPGAITDLLAQPQGEGSVRLAWSAPGDDAGVGTVMNYDIRFASFALSAENFGQGVKAPNPPSPIAAPGNQEFEISNLSDGTTYFFAVKAFDELFNESLSNIASTKTLEIAQSTNTVAGEPELALASQVPGITIHHVSTVTVNPAVAIATSAAAVQGLILAGNLFDILSPDPSLPGGATLNFRYQDLGSDALEQELRVYRFDTAVSMWQLAADVGPDTANNLFSVPLNHLSLFAVLLKDRIAPVTSLNLLEGPKFVSTSGQVFISSQTTHILSASDRPLGKLAGSGVLGTEFRIDTTVAPFEPYVAGFALAFPTEGFHTIQFRSFDLAHNTEPIKSASLGTDATSPAISLASIEPNVLLPGGLAVRGQTASVLIKASDPIKESVASGVSSLSFGLNQTTSSFVVGSSATITLGPGVHQLRVIALDNVGNARNQVFTIVAGDELPPRTVLSEGSPKFTAIDNAELVSSAVTLDQSAFPVTFVSPQSLMVLSSIDDFRQTGDSQGVGVSSIIVGLDGLFSSTFTNPSPAIGQTFVASFNFVGVPDSVYSFRFAGIDVLGQTETLSTRTIAIDSLPPLTRLVASRPLFMENGMLYATSKDTFAFVATDNLSGIERITFKIDDGPDQVFTGEPFSIAQEGTHVVSFNAVDRLGHQEGLQQATIVIDNSPPTFSGTNTVLVQAEDPKNILAGIEAAGGLARLITTTITVFSPENIVWNMGFEGDSLPGSDPQFAVFKRDANISESVQDGIYKVSFTGPVPRDPVQYILSMFSTGVNASVGFTVELRVRAVDDAGMFVSIFAPQVDSTLGISVTPFSREVFMRPRFGQLFFPNIDPREFHVYRLVYRPDNVFKLFVDGMETVVSDYKDPAASFGQQIDNRLRGANFSISGSVEIDYIRVNNQEAREPPPPTIELAGSLAGTVETPFIEFTEVTKINNFQSVENPREGNIVHEFSTDGFNYRPVADLGNADPSSKKVKFRSTLSRNSLAEVSPELDSFSFELKRQVLTTVRAINPTKSKFGINFISSERLIAMPTVTVSGIQAVDGNTPPSFLWNFTATTRPDDPEGIHAIRIEGQDLAGNTGTDETGSIAFDATNPAISVQSPLAGQVYVAAISSIPIEFAVSDLDPNPVISAQLVQVENRGLLRGPTVLTVIAGDRINPLSIDDGIWSFTVSVQDWALNVSSAATEPFEVIHDILAPRTSLAIGAPKIPAFELSAPPSPDPITFVTKQTTFTFSSIDDLVISGDNQGLGVATQTVSVNGVIRSIFVDPSPNQGQSFISQLLLSGDTDGIYAVGFFAEDVIGNKETVQTTTVAVDNSHPLTSVHISGPQFKAIGDVPDAVGGPLFIATHSLISLDAVDPIVNGVASGLQETKFSIDGGAFEVFAASFTLPEGKRTVLITSKDRLNNEEPVKTVEASVDQTPPQTLVSYIGPAAFPDHPADAQPSDVGAFITGDTKIALSAQDPVTQEVASGVKEIKYRINGGEFLVYSGSFTLPSQGVYLIEYFAKDRVDNAEASRFLKVAVDNTAPETSLAVGQPLFEAFGETFITPETPIALSAVDPLVNNAASGLQEILFAVDQTPMAVYSSTFTLAQGTHTVSFLAKDRLGNTEVMQKKIFHVSALLQHALVTGQGASDLDGNVRIEGSVASSGAFTANGNPVSVSSVIASSIRLVGNAVIEGDAILTAGTTDQIELTGNASIKGSRLVNTALAPHPSPIDLAVLLSNISQSNNNHLIPSQYLVNGSLVVKDQTLTLTTGQYLINGLEVAGNGEIKVQGPVALFVRGAIIWEGNAAVNSLGESGNLVIVSTSSTFLAKGNVEAAAFVYAPLSAASIDGNVRLAGHAYFASASIKGNPILYATDGLLPPKEGSNQNNAGNDDGGSKKTASLASAPSQFGPDPAFKLGEAYAYPNPAAGGARPIIHIETGMADSARILIYSISGELVQETNLSGQPQVIDDGQGPQYAYEWGWDGHIPSGTYFYLVEAKKDSEVLRAKGKFYVIR